MLCIKYHSVQSNVPFRAGYKRYLHCLRVNQCKSHAKCLSFSQEIFKGIPRPQEVMGKKHPETYEHSSKSQHDLTIFNNIGY